MLILFVSDLFEVKAAYFLDEEDQTEYPKLIGTCLDVLSREPGNARALDLLVSLLFSMARCKDLSIIYTHLSDIHHDHTHAASLYAICLHHLESRGDDVCMWSDTTRTERQFQQLLNLGTKYANFYGINYSFEAAPKNLHNSISTSFSEQHFQSIFQTFDSQLQHQNSCFRYPNSGSIHSENQCYTYLKILAADDSLSEWKRSIARTCFHARLLWRRHTMAISFSERLMHALESFRGLWILESFDLLTRRELEWLRRQAPVFANNMFQDATKYAERWNIFRGIFSLSERVFRRWWEYYEGIVEDHLHDRFRHMQSVHDILSQHRKPSHQPTHEIIAGLTGQDISRAENLLRSTLPFGCDECLTFSWPQEHVGNYVVSDSLSQKRYSKYAQEKLFDGEHDNREVNIRSVHSSTTIHTPFPFEECLEVDIRGVSPQLSCAMCLLEGCGFCPSLHSCLAISKQNICPTTMITAVSSEKCPK